MKKVLTYGTYDLLHYGHLNLFKRCKELGDELIVGISTDEFNEKKEKNSVLNFEERKNLVESIKLVDKVIEENSWEQKIDDIKKFNIDIFVMGDDWKGKFDYLEQYCEVVYLPRTIGISSTLLKEVISNEVVEGLQ